MQSNWNWKIDGVMPHPCIMENIAGFLDLGLTWTSLLRAILPFSSGNCDLILMGIVHNDKIMRSKIFEQFIYNPHLKMFPSHGNILFHLDWNMSGVGDPIHLISNSRKNDSGRLTCLFNASHFNSSALIKATFLPSQGLAQVSQLIFCWLCSVLHYPT